ncbi:MAG: TonB family protein, partial [Candidatus Contendobacter sp.]|nr:TonB family protein [Candidatus Contendobacter sp.]
KRQAAEEAKRRAAEDAKREAAENAKRQAAEEAKRKAEEAKRKADEEAKRKADEEAKRKAEAEAEARRKEEEAHKLAQELAAREFASSRIKPYVKRQWNPPPDSQSGLSCELVISVTASGAVTNVRISKSSGDALFDNSVKAAALRASPLPMPADAYQSAYIAKQSLQITFRASDSD